MYAFASHPNVLEVMDEPLYAHYLKQAQVQRPYTDLVMTAQNPDGDAVVRLALLPTSPRMMELRARATPEKNLVLIKHITKQRMGLSADSQRQLVQPNTVGVQGDRVLHMMLIRDPFHILKSFHKVLGRDGATLMETALPEMVQIYSDIRSWTGQAPAVLVSEELQRDPPGMLEACCTWLQIPWDVKMLTWPRGPKAYDGVWAPW